MYIFVVKMCLLFVRTYGGVLLPDMASLPDTAMWPLYKTEPFTMTCVSNSFGRMVGSCCRTWRHCQTRRRGTSMNLNRRPCIHACRTRLTTNMFTVRAIAYTHYAVFKSGGRWRYRLSSIQHVTELHVQCWTTSDKWNQGADKPNKTTHAETYIFHALLL